MNKSKQQYTSKDTSINCVSAVYKLIPPICSEVILDYGGGKYDTNVEYMKKEYNTQLLVYDPFNRTQAHNDKVLNFCKLHPVKYVVCSNVLNVIKEDEIIIQILQHIYSLMKKNGWLYIKIYERDKTGVGCETNKGWQRNQRTYEYLPYIRQVFGKDCVVSMKKGMLSLQKI